MSKELRITAVVKLPEDMFDQAARLNEVKPAIAALQEALGVTVVTEVITPRKVAEKPAATAAAAPEPIRETPNERPLPLRGHASGVTAHRSPDEA